MSQDNHRPTTLLKGVLRITLRIATTTSLLVVVLVVTALSWLYWYTSDLPDVRPLASFATPAHTVVAEVPICGQNANVVILPTNDLGALRNVVLAAEGPIDPRPMLRRLYDDLGSDRATRIQFGKYSLQIASHLLCHDHRRVLQHAFAQIRTAIQLERRFSPDQLLNIYLNTAYFDENVYGVESGAQHYFGKHAVELSSAEAALLIGIVGGPGFYSPVRHPDRALARRNKVLDAMAGRNVISEEAAAVAKSAPLETVLTGQ